MTAEIAILNRAALALAADSAVTISVGKKTKVYDTAEKLFELSRNQPLALMIYNNVEFVGVPLDVMIRKFRSDRERSGRIYRTVRESADDFLEYLKTFQHEIDEEKTYLALILRDVFDGIFKGFLRDLRRLMVTNPKGIPAGPKDMLLAAIKKRSAEEAAVPLDGFLADVNLTKFRRRYADVVERVAKDIFKNIDYDRDLAREAGKLAYNLIRSENSSDFITGLVFGGFGEDDMFPTLSYLEFDGTYFGELKIVSCEEIDIDRKRTRAEVVPFAQKEMVERFVNGLDTDVEDSIRNFVTSAINDVIETAAPAEKSETKSAIRRRVNARFRRMLSDLKETSRRDLLDIVYFMSKKELADIAHALVELTSHKRRFSTDDESVGGPIDVAILTKSEGMVWIKRKHYFTPELNESYFSRVFGRGHRRNGGDHERETAGGAAGAAPE